MKKSTVVALLVLAGIVLGVAGGRRVIDLFLFLGFVVGIAALKLWLRDRRYPKPPKYPMRPEYWD